MRHTSWWYSWCDTSSTLAIGAGSNHATVAVGYPPNIPYKSIHILSTTHTRSIYPSQLCSPPQILPEPNLINQPPSTRLIPYPRTTPILSYPSRGYTPSPSVPTVVSSSKLHPSHISPTPSSHSARRPCVNDSATWIVSRLQLWTDLFRNLVYTTRRRPQLRSCIRIRVRVRVLRHRARSLGPRLGNYCTVSGGDGVRDGCGLGRSWAMMWRVPWRTWPVGQHFGAREGWEVGC